MRCQAWRLGERQCQQPATRGGYCDWHRDERLDRLEDAARAQDPEPCPRSSP